MSIETTGEPTEQPDDTASTTPEPTEPSKAKSDESETSSRDQTDNRNREAAKYRKAARDAETERDQLRTQVESLQRSIVEGVIAREHNVKPSAVWAFGATPGELLDEDGQPDTQKIRETVDAAVEAFGLERTPRLPAPNPAIGSSAAGPPSRSTNSWGDLLGRR